jgi:hypothetical protein
LVLCAATIVLRAGRIYIVIGQWPSSAWFVENGVYFRDCPGRQSEWRWWLPYWKVVLLSLILPTVWFAPQGLADGAVGWVFVTIVATTFAPRRRRAERCWIAVRNAGQTTRSKAGERSPWRAMLQSIYSCHPSRS